jgi:hypothetical protein
MENKNEKSDWFIVRFYKKNHEVIEKYVRMYLNWLTFTIKENYVGFRKTLGALLSTSLPLLILWLVIIAPVIAVFTMNAKMHAYEVKKYENKGITSIHAIIDPLQDIASNLVLMTNFLGVRFWNDNSYNTQIGYFQMTRHNVLVYRDYIGRNRSSNPVNLFLRRAHNEISLDSTAIFYPANFDLQLRRTLSNLRKYENALVEDQDKNMVDRKALFIANSDNFGKALRKLREELLSVSDIEGDIAFLNSDDDYDNLRGHLISLYEFINGLENDFKEKMIKKGVYEEIYIPMITKINNVIKKRPFFVSELMFNHVSTLRGNAQAIAIKMEELASKLDDG